MGISYVLRVRRASVAAASARLGDQQLCVLAGTIVVTRAVYYGHDPSGYYTFWYLWIGVYASSSSGRAGAPPGWERRRRLACLGAHRGLGARRRCPRWIVTVGSILVAGLLVDALATRLRRESTAAARRASNMRGGQRGCPPAATQSDSHAVGWAICSAAVRTAGGLRGRALAADDLG